MSDTDNPDERDASGRYLPGSGGRHGGRKRLRQDVRDMLEDATPKAAKRLIEALDATYAVTRWVGKDQQEVEHVDDFDMRVKAATLIMERIHGKAPQSIAIEDVTDRGGAIALDSLTSEELAALQVLKSAKLRLEAAKKDDDK